jgi:hypothetical protein
VNKNLDLEFGYRYLDLGEAKSGAIVCQTQPIATCPFEVQKYHLASHDIHIGMRWRFGGGYATTKVADAYAAGGVADGGYAYAAPAGGVYAGGAYSAGAAYGGGASYAGDATAVRPVSHAPARHAAPRKRHPTTSDPGMSEQSY